MNQRLERDAVSDASAVGMSSSNSTEKTCAGASTKIFVGTFCLLSILIW